MERLINLVKKNFFRDSLQLMQLSEEAKKIDGVLDAAIVMGTDTNKEILERLGLLNEEGRTATPNDMILAVKVRDERELPRIIAAIEYMLTSPKAPFELGRERIYYSVDSALESMPDASLAVISIPGQHVKEVALKLLEKGIHLHIFSDHVPIEDELEIKKYASEKGLLVLGPGAGTSIIAGRAIAFANRVTRGPVGIVAAAGTGLQEVSVLLEQAGVGVSHGLGVGGNDLKEEIGGIMTMQCIKALEEDDETSLILVVSKAFDRQMFNKLIDFIDSECRKPFILCLLGATRYRLSRELAKRVRLCRTLHATVLEAVKIVRPEKYGEFKSRVLLRLSEFKKLCTQLSKGLKDDQKYIRALYTGGTLAHEALLIYHALLGKDVYSNAPLDPKYKLPDSFSSLKNTVLDLGEEEFTAGRPHPMIDPTVRKIRLIDEAKDPKVAVITMDFVGGYGAHHDPVGAMREAIIEAKRIAEKDGRKIVFMAHVCGTDADPQNLSSQEENLKSLGVVTFPTNAGMAFASALVAKRGRIPQQKLSRIYKEYLTP